MIRSRFVKQLHRLFGVALFMALLTPWAVFAQVQPVYIGGISNVTGEYFVDREYYEERACYDDREYYADPEYDFDPEYYSNQYFDSEDDRCYNYLAATDYEHFTNLKLTRTDAMISFGWAGGSPDASIPVDHFSVRWTGQVEPLYTEDYTFAIYSDDGVRLWVNDQLIINNFTDHAGRWDSGVISLEAGQKYTFIMEFYERGGHAAAHLYWGSPSSTSWQAIPPTSTAPSVSLTEVSDGAVYEFGQVPTAACLVQDNEDGSLAIAASLSAISGPRASAGLGSQTASCSYTDTGGQTGSASATYSIVDSTPPQISGMPVDQTLEATGATGAAAIWAAPTANDTIDGALSVSCSPASGTTFALGTTTVTCGAVDGAGNRASSSFTVRVIYNWSGFLPPLNQDGSSRFKAGSTVPVKLKLQGASAGIPDAAIRISVTKLSDSGTGTGTEVPVTATNDTGNLLRYDPANDQYIYNLSTRNWAPGDYLISLDFGDGSTGNSVKISTRK